MYRDREFPGSAIFVAWLKVTNNIDCGVQITRMVEPRIFDVGNDRIRERPNPGMTESGNNRTREVRARCIPRYAPVPVN
jgi:hypothetical protein